jgi:glutamyl-tRNA reductase
MRFCQANSDLPMLNLVLVGLNHRTASLDFRQLASFNAIQLPEELKRLSARPAILESMIISTCNRVEILSNVDDQSNGIESIESFLAEFSRISLPILQPKLYRYSDDQAIRHVFRVASSLDSMILGEPQILGQLKSCYSIAVDAQTVGTYLNSLLQASFRAAKRVRTETSIGEYSVSVSSAAVELIRKIFDDIKKKSILIIGAGEMAEAALQHLGESGARVVYIANRSPEAAKDLAMRFSGIAVPFNELREWISRSDIIFTSTGAQETLINPSMAQEIMHSRKNTPMVFIDISVPRNVDPGVGNIENVFCYDIDDLGTVVESNLQERVKAASAAEKIVEQEVEALCSKLRSLRAVPVVMQVQNRIEEICRLELERSLKKLGPQEPRNVQELESMASRIAAKIAHPLVMQLRNEQDPMHESVYVDLIKRIFKPKDKEE